MASSDEEAPLLPARDLPNHLIHDDPNIPPELDPPGDFEECKKAFDEVDIDGVGYIEGKDLRQAIASLYRISQRRFTPLSQNEVEKLILEMQDPTDKKIHLRDFYRWWMRTKERRDSDPAEKKVYARSPPRDQLQRQQSWRAYVAPFFRQESYTMTLKEESFCHICQEYHEKSETIGLSCGHRFGRSCFEGYVRNKIINGEVYMKCFYPIEDGKQGACDKTIEAADVMPLLDDGLQKKYNRFKLSQDNPNVRHCSSCETSQVGDELNPIMICIGCGRSYCFIHGDRHPNSTCAELERQILAETKKNKAYLAKSRSKPCPRCGIPIIKDGGCNHMKCTVTTCRCSFCWLCLAEIDDSNTPLHFAPTSDSPCAGRQFSQQPPTISMQARHLTGWRKYLFLTLGFLAGCFYYLIVWPIAFVLTIVGMAISVSFCCCFRVLNNVFSWREWRHWISMYFAACSNLTCCCLGCLLCPLTTLCLCGLFCIGAVRDSEQEEEIEDITITV